MPEFNENNINEKVNKNSEISRDRERLEKNKEFHSQIRNKSEKHEDIITFELIENSLNNIEKVLKPRQPLISPAEEVSIIETVKEVIGDKSLNSLSEEEKDNLVNIVKDKFGISNKITERDIRQEENEKSIEGRKNRLDAEWKNNAKS